MYKIVVRKKEPEFMKGSSYETLLKYRETIEFQKRSKQAKINKRGGVEGDNVEPTHYSGSQSSYERALQTAKSNKGKLPSVVEIFLDTHTKSGPDGEKRFQKKKDAAIYDAYLRGVEENPSQKSDNEIWFDAAQGYKKGVVYGVGNAQDLFHDAPSCRASSRQGYMPGIVTQLQEQLEGQ